MRDEELELESGDRAARSASHLEHGAAPQVLARALAR